MVLIKRKEGIQSFKLISLKSYRLLIYIGDNLFITFEFVFASQLLHVLWQDHDFRVLY